ncbi:type II toxin-antitoxin system YhaV family toxin [Sulfuritalea sp.]|uniref:type II toxin-antitoxin system YhaV family toxin n=1 Tax=Sulfuritalea sp. TaxID=2480090 RepID=UPI00286E2294|nr:type II toxin-antitoxin system YhaV family toxin [Sulfuritalea sp.]
MTQAPAPLVVNGWSLFAHPLFLDQVQALIARVEGLKAKDPKTWRQKNSSKRLAATTKLALDVIPENPARPEYRQGGTLGDDRKHWFRAKFYQQYRLFFRFHAAQRVIVYAWVNDEDSKRAYQSDDDAYRVFRKMLDGGNPPDDWDSLFKEARGSLKRLAAISKVGD